MDIYLYTIGSVILVSLISLIGIIPLMKKKKIPESTLLFMVSLSAGALFAVTFLDFIPEGLEHTSYSLTFALSILAGILTLFVLEKFIHYRHEHEHESKTHKKVHSHAYHLAPMNLIGDGIHNFLDGLVIAAGYLISIPTGIAATVAVILHEVPQEIADFGVLLYSGYSKMKALLFNFLSATTAIIGAIIGIIFGSSESFLAFVLPFAAGCFIYIAGSNLLPELHKHCSLKESSKHLLALLLGIATMVLITQFAPGHV